MASRYLSQIFKSVSTIAGKQQLTNADLNQVQGLIQNWDKIQKEQQRVEAQKAGIQSYFFYTLNRGFYNLITSFFSRPYTNRPTFMNTFADILEILSNINEQWNNIVSVLHNTRGRNPSAADKKRVSDLFDMIFKLIEGSDLRGKFRMLHDEVNGLSLSEINLSNNQALFNNIPFDKTKNTFGVHIDWIDSIVDYWVEFANKQRQSLLQEGVENAFNRWMSDPSIRFEVAEKINNYYLMGKDYNPDHIMQWVGLEGTAQKNSINANQWNTHLDTTINQFVLIPQQVIGEEYHDFSPDMKLLIMSILQISDWSIRTGKLIDDAIVNRGENEEMRRVREAHAPIDKIKMQFKNDLRRYFLSYKNYEKYGKAVYENTVTGQTPTQNRTIGMLKMVKRMGMLKQGSHKIELARTSISSWPNNEWIRVQDIIAQLDDRMVRNNNSSNNNRGGRRKKKRKTRSRRKKKTKKRKTRKRKKKTKKRKHRKKRRKSRKR
jgi:hypothetical protein